MTCCVIGGAGFIGAQVTRHLVDSGRRVVVLGRRTLPEAIVPENITYISGDYGNRALLNKILSGVNEVINLAYATVPQTSFDDPSFDLLSNLPPTLGLLHEAVAAKLRRVVVVSSGGTVYGVASSLPLTEEHETNPISPYGITKLTIEKYALMFNRVSDLPVLIVRPSNAYGEDQRAFTGQGFIATAMHSIISRKEVEIFGTEGTIRDYVHVSDVASGIVAVLDKGEPGNVYNIGSGVGKSNLDILHDLEPLVRQLGYPLRTKVSPHRRFDVPANVLDIRKLCDATGWRPQVSFMSGLKRVWEAVLAGYRK